MLKFKVGDKIYLAKNLYILPSAKVNDIFIIEEIDDNLVQLRYTKKDILQFILTSHFNYFELVNYVEKHTEDND